MLDRLSLRRHDVSGQQMDFTGARRHGRELFIVQQPQDRIPAVQG
jgi:hypothetical protein